MSTENIFIILAILIGSGIIAFFLKKNSRQDNSQISVLIEKLTNLQDQNKELRTLLDLKLSQTNQAVQEQYKTSQVQTGHVFKTVQAISAESSKLISQVTEKLTKLDETNKRVIDFSSQLQGLQDILKNPKQRGVLGEYFLEETLKNVLPPNSYKMQYKFKNNEIVDAAVIVKDKIIPVDSKFSLETYEKILVCKDKEERQKLEKTFRQDLKNRIDETSKYIRPEENTFEFAFMFIPSEAIYYDLLINKVGAVEIDTRSLIEYAFREKKVVIVSPTSFLAYLQTVLQGLKAMAIEENAKQIKANVEKLSKHIIVYDEFLRKVGVSLGTTVNHYNNAYKEFKKIDKDIAKITGEEEKVEVLLVEKAGQED